MPIDIDKLRDIAVTYTSAWCSQDASSVAAFFASNGSLTVNGGTAAEGRRAITELVQSFMTAFPDMKVLMNDVVLTNDHAEYHWTLAGTNDGPGGTGNRVRISGFEVWQIGEDGKILSSQGHFDDVEYQRQLENSLEEQAS